MSKYFEIKDEFIQEVDKGQRCLFCNDRCPGFSPHPWKISCNKCRCPRFYHDIYYQDFVDVRNIIDLKTPSDPYKISNKQKTLEEGYTWIPTGLDSQNIHDYFLHIPIQKVPQLGTPGQRYRDRQLIIQLPKQDFSLQHCKFLDRRYQNNYNEFINHRNEKALDIGYVKRVIKETAECFQCNGILLLGSFAIIAPRFGERIFWHPSCFVCCICNELLVDLVYCMKDLKLYCERHYAEEIRPRCAACDELIFAREYIKAISKEWHTTHFCCWKCDDVLTGQRYVLKNEDPYCIRCFERTYSNICNECGKIIGIDSKDLFYNDKHWHEVCFACCKCHERLANKLFGLKRNKIYCTDCYDNSFYASCNACNEIFQTGNKKVEYKGKYWHEKCFCCIICKKQVRNKTFVPKDNKIYCTACYQQKFSIKCKKCNQIITNGAMTNYNEYWHRECFCCSKCLMCLAERRFIFREGKLYCIECFGELFAQRCTVCNRPISSTGGTRFISFENRSCHTDCFLCSICKTSLVGKGFKIRGSNTLCSECAKLM